MNYPRHNVHRGSTLLAVLILMSVMAIGVTGYTAYCYRSLALSSRSFQHERVWQLAEAGLEQALWALNHDSLITGFDGWTPVGSAAERTFTHNLEGDVTAAVLVRVVDYSSTSLEYPITVTSSVTLPDGTVLTRQLKSKAKLLPTFINAIAGINSVDFGSNTPVIDSYRSDIGPYSVSNIGYAGVISGDRLAIHKAQVKGYLTAGISTKTLELDIDYHDAKGKGKGSVSATVKGPNTASDVNIDPQRIGSNVTQPLPEIRMPEGATLFTPGTQTIKLADPEVYYFANDMNLGSFGNNVVTIERPVQLHVPGSIQLAHPLLNGKIIIKTGGSLEIFVEKNFHVPTSSLFGTSINDFIENQTNNPNALVVYATQSTNYYTTDLTIKDGSDAFYAAFYFPASDLKIRGDGHLYGSIVAKTVELLGNTKIHYDKSLRETSFRGLRIPYVVDAVEEVFASD